MTAGALTVVGGSIVTGVSGSILVVNGNVNLNNGGQVTGSATVCISGSLSGTLGSSVNTAGCESQNINIAGELLYSQFYGRKVYELSNHLGNVLVAVSDNKLYKNGTFIADAIWQQAP